MLDICKPPSILPAERPLALCLHDDIAVLWYYGMDGAPSATICSLPAHGARYIQLEVVAPETNSAKMAHLDVDATEVEASAPTSKSSTYSSNGQSATGREVILRMNELNIQVGNLCPFFPQDKVSEFAQMTPASFFEKCSVRLVTSGYVSAWHETLINAGKEAREMQEFLDADRAQPKTLEERNRQLENEVDRFNEGKRIEDEFAILELLLSTAASSHPVAEPITTKSPPPHSEYESEAEEVGHGREVEGDVSMVSIPEDDAKEAGSLAMVEPLRRKDSLAGGESEGVQGPERPTQEESLPERSPRTQNATRILSSPILSPASTATLFTAQPPIPYSPTEPPILESPASSNVVYSASHPPPPSSSTRFAVLSVYISVRRSPDTFCAALLVYLLPSLHHPSLPASPPPHSSSHTHIISAFTHITSPHPIPPHPTACKT
ncbi:uncharacterized protein STEHIDRAFT_163457 [Stereum hirsutum FP-91666 SS1]|uniref:Uncharacterized protein n=1 Tax=Stereum hirsutum (strain FP-91666) TaxID=721885 RepID=R7RXW1_STEHR|nr:uncharacterized protein STEHIDRAFT_163457 [Stereum hirsutum FP-91666 SS1]EIM79633.1 hypothetical protein STEHIDRAFT_163457 [Stereum hirsutum FP-91666 SS1]